MLLEWKGIRTREEVLRKRLKVWAEWIWKSSGETRFYPNTWFSEICIYSLSCPERSCAFNLALLPAQTISFNWCFVFSSIASSAALGGSLSFMHIILSTTTFWSYTQPFSLLLFSELSFIVYLSYVTAAPVFLPLFGFIFCSKHWWGLLLFFFLLCTEFCLRVW